MKGGADCKIVLDRGFALGRFIHVLGAIDYALHWEVSAPYCFTIESPFCTFRGYPLRLNVG